MTVTTEMRDIAEKVAVAVHLQARHLSPAAKKALTFADFERLTVAAHKAVIDALSKAPKE